jgi:hypothetical protein
VVAISIYWKDKRIVLGKIVHGKKTRKCPTIEKSVISIFKSKLIDKELVLVVVFGIMYKQIKSCLSFDNIFNKHYEQFVSPWQ